MYISLAGSLAIALYKHFGIQPEEKQKRYNSGDQSTIDPAQVKRCCKLKFMMMKNDETKVVNLQCGLNLIRLAHETTVYAVWIFLFPWDGNCFVIKRKNTCSNLNNQTLR